MNNKQAVLFDLDGTLIDSEYFYYSNWAPILSAEYQLHITYEDWINYFAGHTLVDNVKLLKTQWNIESTPEFMWQRTRANYARSDMRSIQLMPYAKEILDFVQDKQCRIGLVTSSYQSTVDTVLGEHGLLDYFEFIVCREKVQQPKPDPEPYLLATALLGLPKEAIVVIEDTSTGVAAAKAAGLSCIAVSRHPSERGKLSKADLLAEDLSEVISILSREYYTNDLL